MGKLNFKNAAFIKKRLGNVQKGIPSGLSQRSLKKTTILLILLAKTLAYTKRLTNAFQAHFVLSFFKGIGRLRVHVQDCMLYSMLVPKVS